MKLHTLIIMFIFLVWASIYTISYGVWTWRMKNIFGAVMIFILPVLIVGLPIYLLYIIG